jgi:DNA-binding transcriptional LysR family regulator
LRVQVRSFEAVCRLVQAGLGVGLLPLEPSVGLAADMGLKVLPLSDEWAVRHMHVCCTRGHPHGSPVARLVRHLSQSRPA